MGPAIRGGGGLAHEEPGPIMVFPPPSVVLWSGANFHQWEVVQLFCSRHFQKGGCFARRSKVVDKVDLSSYRKVYGMPGSFRIRLCTWDSHREGVEVVCLHRPRHLAHPGVRHLACPKRISTTSELPARCGRELSETV